MVVPRRSPLVETAGVADPTSTSTLGAVASGRQSPMSSVRRGPAHTSTTLSATRSVQVVAEHLDRLLEACELQFPVERGEHLLRLRQHRLGGLALRGWLLTRESHQGFKSTRERVRDEVAGKLPLFGFYRALLRWLLLDPTSEPPVHEGVELALID